MERFFLDLPTAAAVLAQGALMQSPMPKMLGKL